MTVIKLGDSFDNEGGTSDSEIIENEIAEEKAEVKPDEDSEDISEVIADSKDEKSEEKSDDGSNAGSDDATQDGDVDVVKELSALDALKQQKQELLNEIVQIRRERREARSSEEQDIFVPRSSVKKDAALEDVAPADIELIEKVVTKLGYVKKDEIQKTSYQQELTRLQDSWLEKHPEYLPENDPDDKKWTMLKQTVKNIFEVAPSDPKKVVKMLEIAHKEINPSLVLPVKSRATVNASNAKIASSNKSGGGATAPSKTSNKANLDRSKFVGFSDEELDELLN